MKKGIKLDGKKIQSLRETKNWTQTQLGADVMKEKSLKTLSLRTIQRIEKDPEYLCSKITIEQLAKVLEVEVKELIFKQGEIVTNQLETKRDGKKSSNTIKSFEEEEKSFGKIVFDKKMQFCLDEAQLNYIEDKLTHPMDGRMFEEAAWKIIEDIRQFKFRDVDYDTFTNENTRIDEGLFDIFYKANRLSLGERLFNRSKYELKIDRLYGIESFFESLSRVSRYSIDSNLPRNENMLTIICNLTDAIEDYLQPDQSEQSELRTSETIKHKFNIANAIKPFRDPDNRMSIFYEDRKFTYSDIKNKTMSRSWFEERAVRILIKNWEDSRVLTLDYCWEEPMENINLYNIVRYRPPLEIETPEGEAPF